jgi:hypothetical protein
LDACACGDGPKIAYDSGLTRIRCCVASCASRAEDSWCVHICVRACVRACVCVCVRAAQANLRGLAQCVRPRNYHMPRDCCDAEGQQDLVLHGMRNFESHREQYFAAVGAACLIGCVWQRALSYVCRYLRCDISGARGRACVRACPRVRAVARVGRRSARCRMLTQFCCTSRHMIVPSASARTIAGKLTGSTMMTAPSSGRRHLHTHAHAHTHARARTHTYARTARGGTRSSFCSSSWC